MPPNKGLGVTHTWHPARVQADFSALDQCATIGKQARRGQGSLVTTGFVTGLLQAVEIYPIAYITSKRVHGFLRDLQPLQPDEDELLNQQAPLWILPRQPA